MKKKINFFPNIEKYQFSKLFYSLKIFSIFITGIVFFMYLIFSLLLHFKTFNPELKTFYTVLIPDLLIIIFSIVALYKELIGSILVIFILFIKIIFDEYSFNIFIDLLLINSVINLYLFWGTVRDRN